MAKPASVVRGQCVCAAVRIEVGFPAVWAWHDHSKTTQHAHGAACATYIGCWRSKISITEGADVITRFEDPATNTARSFCARCGTPVFYERGHSPQMVNLPRALFASRTGREPRYHVRFEERPDWAYAGEPLSPLKGYPGVLRTRASKRKPPDFSDPA